MFHEVVPEWDGLIFQQLLLLAFDFGKANALMRKKMTSGYPKRELGVTMHFSEIIKLQFGKEQHTLLCILKLFTNIVD